MSRQQLSQHYSRLLSRWPIDLVRPQERHFQNLLKSRIAAAPANHTNEKAEVNAAYLLIDNTFAKQFPLGDRMMKPASNPSHYSDLARELEEAPHRSWFGNFKKRMANLVRFR